MKPNGKWSETDLAYFAGILDGEGCLSLHESVSRKGIPFHTASIRVANTDERMIAWIQKRFPGKVDLRQPRNDNAKPMWHWQLWGPAVEETLTEVSPYLVCKREQAELLVEFRRTVGRRGHPVGWHRGERTLSQDTLDRRDEIKTRIAILNKRGVA